LLHCEQEKAYGTISKIEIFLSEAVLKGHPGSRMTIEEKVSQMGSEAPYNGYFAHPFEFPSYGNAQRQQPNLA
jgi:hypothetical protein